MRGRGAAAPPPVAAAPVAAPVSAETKAFLEAVEGLLEKI